MCDSVKPDLLIITTIDVYHEEYIVKALDRKIGIISEKPLCINSQQCRSILAAHKRNPETFARTSHNARYDLPTQTLKKVLDSGIIGKVLSFNYQEALDMRHGLSYFRRWNSRRKYSNGLQLHKSCHHFDKIHYLLNTKAIEVMANGSLSVYGSKAPHAFEGDRCHTCQYGNECPYNAHYAESEGENLCYVCFFKYRTNKESYTPDYCIFSSEIDIEDNFSAIIKYENGIFGTYSLCAHANYEGETIWLEGETGRLELETRYFFKPIAQDMHNMHCTQSKKLRLYRFGCNEPEEIPIPEADPALGHGGADDIIFEKFFGNKVDLEQPTLEDGIQAVLVGAAVVESMKTGKAIAVQEQLLGE
jgi:predicted dehydrogenase